MDTIPLSAPILMDGATGTELLKRGMPAGACTEQWVLEHPQVLLEVQRSYVAAGSRILLAPTFGANRASLERRGITGQVGEYNRRLVELTRQAAGEGVLVAGDLAPAGLALVPFGESSFEELVAVYTEQAAALEAAGVDLFVLETMTGMADARAAVLACRSVSDKPVWVTFTCDDEGRTPAGTDVLAGLIVMQGMGVAAFGLNCTNPQDTAEQLERLTPYASVPLIAKPSAGLPGACCTPEELAALAPRYAAAGARIFGGCCGTTEAHIAALGRAAAQVDFTAFPPVERDPDVIPCASEKEARFITPDVDVGETIECTPDLMEDILAAEETSPQGALKIAILEEDDLDIFAENQYVVKDALCLWSDVPELLEKALRLYQGRAFWDGTGDLEEEFLQRMAQRYGLVLL
ncbi:homocysteine methyltransferase [Flavonifractor sp. An82]|uniref:homocysteine S-methyltransferase family protein n=1 Tax=Flavonifractor sp. An82 TaxID=1965660 RepID=UPI000B37DF07|nr:homocysteine S-methyltransferase family protein [Flavonifractor sp. An82]OUN23101.1 homocysteine methyltransferase [Flavonifractor sp. An82]